MKIYRSLEEIQEQFPYPCVTIGNFDGVHLGHQLLFAEVVERAFKHKGTSVVVTFAPHPFKVLRPEGVKLISTIEHKVELIEQAGIDVSVIIPFNKQFASMPALAFVNDILLGTIGVRELVVGYDYAFGKGREGSIDFLKQQGREKGFPVHVVQARYEEGMLVSSTKVRELVTEGRMQDVYKLLGRFYQIRGTVQRGRQRGGRIVGFPTANLQVSEEDLCPKKGVYVTQVIYSGKCYGGVANIGYNPTFGEDRLVAETHIFDFNDDIYDQSIKINLLKHLRGEIKFAGPAELAAQIRHDIVAAREILEGVMREHLVICREDSEASG